MVDYSAHYRQYELCLLSPLVPSSTRTMWEQVLVDTGAVPLLRNNKLWEPLGGCRQHAQEDMIDIVLVKTSLFSALEEDTVSAFQGYLLCTCP